MQELDVGCNELCAVEGYDEAIKAMRMKMSTLKKLNDEEVSVNVIRTYFFSPNPMFCLFCREFQGLRCVHK